jgi:metal-responsive CopG/Arc/MetJ family transcriptional regulator
MPMKTAISLPDDLFVLADNFAKQHGLSRSELFATALRNYLAAQRHEDLTARINRACENLNTALPQELAPVVRRKLLEAEW